jgi:hypothetical protein
VHRGASFRSASPRAGPKVPIGSLCGPFRHLVGRFDRSVPAMAAPASAVALGILGCEDGMVRGPSRKVRLCRSSALVFRVLICEAEGFSA